MKDTSDKDIILCPPNPEFLIKSIAEQGYSLETAFADLIDNSISAEADKIEILSLTENNFTVFISDNGTGMTRHELIESLAIPSASVESERGKKDLGRFGLGLKTASFSQTRKLTVLSKSADEKMYRAFSWDVSLLQKTRKWSLYALKDAEIDAVLHSYQKASDSHLAAFENYVPSTVVVWEGLYKYENYLEEENRINALNTDLSDNVEEHLSIAFHRFLKKGLEIRLNNKLIKGFDPFPDIDTVQRLPKRRGMIKDSVVQFESVVLPYAALKESKRGINGWTTPKMGLMDMEGIYIYRGDRLISYGGWHGIIKRSGKLQLGRMKIDIGNTIDNVLKLNVAKSQIEIPYELKQEFHKALAELQISAQREFYNVGIKQIPAQSLQISQPEKDFFTKIYTSNGALLYVDEQNPLIDFLMDSLDDVQKKLFRIFIKNVNTAFNRNRQFDKDIIIKEDTANIKLDEIETAVAKLRELGINDEGIKKIYLSNIISGPEINHIL